MIYKWFRLLLLLLLSGVVYSVFQVGIPFLESPLPAFGKLLNPSTGLWKNNHTLTKPQEEVSIDALTDDVNIYWDDRNVPHIFAKNNYDLYFSQGYVTAKDRLWQMDFITRASSGRLAEVVGKKAANFDQFHRRIGLPSAAKMVIDTLAAYPDELEALEAYTDGVNAYISQLKVADRPIEFKLLNYSPEKWSPYKSALVLKYMAWDLDGSPSERYITDAKEALGDELFSRAFPLQRPYTKPVVPAPVRRWRRSWQPNTIQNVRPISAPNQQFYERSYRKGSNNWVVNGSKTRSGKPILANDPHLSLSLPALWYENQLVSNDCNVYGVSLPGIPMTVIGFNKDVAWGLTYATSDCIDFVEVDINEEGNQYRLDGKWENARITKDTILIKGAQNRINQTFHTKFGPVIYTDTIPSEGYNHFIPGQNVAMNWTSNAPTLEFLSMYRLNRAKNLEDYKAALPYFSAPAQNFVFASKDNDIAIWHNGRFPIREEEKARYTNVKATSDLIWGDDIPFDQLPHSINPAQGYIVSANQQPAAANYGYYLGSDDYSDFERSSRINEYIAGLDKIVPEDFQRLQLDNKSMMADLLLPTLLTSIQTMVLEDNSLLNQTEKDIILELENWDLNYSNYSKSPGFFHSWLRELSVQIWQDEVKPDFHSNKYWLPEYDVTTQLILTNSDPLIIDNKETEEIELVDDIIISSFQSAVKKHTEKYGSLNEDWEWGNINPTEINSMADIDGFGYSEPLITGGASDAVNAINGDVGPSWRMVVALDDDQPYAYGVYPGGQSGNPGSEDYDSFVETWAKGGYYKLHLFPDESKINIPVTTTKMIKSK